MGDCKCILWCIFWLLVLIFIGWPVSIFLGAVYGFIAPLTTCCGLEQITELLLQGSEPGPDLRSERKRWKIALLRGTKADVEETCVSGRAFTDAERDLPISLVAA